MEAMTDVRTALKRGLARLREAQVPSFTLATELLLLHVLDRDRTWLYAHPEEQISAADAERFFALIGRRANGASCGPSEWPVSSATQVSQESRAWNEKEVERVSRTSS